MDQLMRTFRGVLVALAFGAFVAPITARAQDDDDESSDDETSDDEVDSPEEEGPAGGGTEEEEEGTVPTASEEEAERETRARPDVDSEEPEPAVARESKPRARRKAREVVKGAYIKANVGPVIWLPPLSDVTSSTGTETDFSFGYDVVDRLPFTLAIEASFMTLVTNGTGVNDETAFQALLAAGIAPTIQGDFRVFAGTVAVRFGPNFGGKKIRRANFSIQVGGGGGYSPALIDIKDPVIANRINANGLGYIMQGRFLGILTPGLAIEYYTKLSHFSVGLDVDADIILGGPQVAVGLGLNFFAKYTF